MTSNTRNGCNGRSRKTLKGNFGELPIEIPALGVVLDLENCGLGLP